MRITAGLALCCLLGLGCSRRSSPLPAPEPPAVTSPGSLEEVIRRTELAFWPRGDAFEARQPTWVVQVDGEGVRFEVARAALVLGRTRVTRGTWRDDEAQASWRRLDDGALWRPAAGFAERLQNTDQGLEQSWHFEAAPPGEGPLVVRVPVVSAERVEATAGGLHFAQGTRFVRYGHGTWIDADGARTAVPARFEGGAATLEVPAEVLAASRFPAVLDPLVSAEQDVDALTPVAAYNPQDNPSLASNGTSSLATWRDFRASAEVFAARLDASGQVLDTFGLPLGLSNPDGLEHPAAVASDGTDFLVVYGAGSQGLHGVRVTASGQVMDRPPLQLSDGRWTESAAIWTGAEYVVAAIEWSLDSVGSLTADNLVVLAVSPSGVVTNRALLTSRALASTALSLPRVASNGAMHFVSYQEGSTVYARRLAPDLTLLDATPLTLFAGVSESHLAWDGQRFLATALSNGVVASRVSTSGVILDRPPFRVSSGSVSSHATASDDAGVGVTWLESRSGVTGLYGARVTPMGTVVDVSASALVTSPGTSARARMVRTTPGFLSVWRANQANSSNDILGARLSPRLTALDPEPLRVSMSTPRQERLDLAWNGTSYLAAWFDARTTPGSLYTARLARDGTPLAPLATAGAVSVPGLVRPAVASDGTGWLVTWQQSGNAADIFASRVYADGTWAIDGGAPLVGRFGDQTSPDVAWVGDRYLVVYAEGAGVGADLYAIPVAADGTGSPDAGFLVNGVPGEQQAPRIAVTDGGALVVWLDRRDAGSLNVFGARLSATGQVLDPQGFPISDHSRSKGGAAVAGGADGYLVCWDDARSLSWYQPYAARVSPTLGLLDDAGVRLSARQGASLSDCAPGWDGEAYFVAMAATSYLVSSTDPSYGQLRGTWVGTDGRILDGGLADGGDWVLLSAPMRQMARTPTVGSPGHRQVLLGYTVEASIDGGGVLRVRTRTLTRGVAPVATGGVATTPEEQPVEVALTASDDDGDALTFVVASAPRNGVAVGVDGGVRYVPAPDFSGEERFTVAADDGALLSAPVDVVVTVTPVDDVPVAPSLTVATDEDEGVDVVVPARDADDAGLALLVRQAPASGTLTGAPPTLRYTPAPDFAGRDAFTYALTDGVTASPEARVEITVRPRPDAPVAADGARSLDEDTVADVVLAASDVDGDLLSFEVLAGPEHGTLEGTAPQLRYAPARDYAGADQLTFRVSDGLDASTAVVRLTVTPVNDPPVARAASLEARGGEPRAFTLRADDVDDTALAFSVVTGPSSGTLSGDPPALVYTPSPSFGGEDELTFEVTDAAGARSTAVVRFQVTAVPVPTPPPSCGCTGGVGPLGLGLLLLVGCRPRRRRAATG